MTQQTIRNELQRAILKYPDAGWNYSNLSANPNITMDFIIDNPHLRLITSASIHFSNPSISRLDFDTNPEIFFRYCNKHLTRSCDNCIDKYTCKNLKIEYNTVSEKNTFAYISDNPQILWDYKSISRHDSVNMKVVKKYPNIRWDFNTLSDHKNITIIDILNNPDLQWSTHIAYNRNIYIREILENNLPWDFTKLSTMSNLTLKSILDHPQIQFNFEFLLREGVLSVKEALEHQELSEHFRDELLLSASLDITLSDILDNPQVKWHADSLALNMSVLVEYEMSPIALREKFDRKFRLDFYGNTLCNIEKTVKISMNHMNHMDRSFIMSYASMRRYSYDRYFNNKIFKKKLIRRSGILIDNNEI